MSFTGKLTFTKSETKEFHYLIKGLKPLSKVLINFDSDIWKQASATNSKYSLESEIEFRMDHIKIYSHNRKVKVIFNLIEGEIHFID